MTPVYILGRSRQPCYCFRAGTLLGRAMDWGDRWRACGGCHRVEETICWSFIVIIIFFIYIHSDSRRLRIGFVFIVIISIVVLYIQTLGG